MGQPKVDVEFELLHAALNFIRQEGLMDKFETRRHWCDDTCACKKNR